MDGLTFDKYKAFRKMCTAAEWSTFEPEVSWADEGCLAVGAAENPWKTEQEIPIYKI